MKRVKEFHKKMKLAIDEPYSKELMNFRLKLIFEEVQELAEAALDIEDEHYKEEQIILMEVLFSESLILFY